MDEPSLQSFRVHYAILDAKQLEESRNGKRLRRGQRILNHSDDLRICQLEVVFVLLDLIDEPTLRWKLGALLEDEREQFSGT